MSRRGAHRRTSSSRYASLVPASGRSYRSSRRRGSRRTLTAVLLALVLLVVVAIAFVAVQLARTVPTASATIVLPDRMTTPGTPPHLATPAQGTTDVEVAGVGTLAQVDAERAVPLASVAKLVAALVVLHDHPLTPGQQGPTLTVSAALGAAYPAEQAANDSVIPVVVGEHLTELQCLEAMLIPSADNVADLLATWDRGSEAAFVAAMNAEAASLGLTHTHFADASGLDPASQGSAADMVRLAQTVMAQPVLRQIVALPELTLPLAGTVANYDTDLGHDGIVGIKTGSTTQAGGNFLFAAERRIAGRVVTVLGAVFGEQGPQPLTTALAHAEPLVTAAFAAVHEETILPAGRTVLRFATPWGSTVTAATTREIRALGFAGEAVTARITLTGAAARGDVRSLRPGEQVGTVTLLLPGGATLTVPVASVGTLSGPSSSWRLERL
jgi:D-alanyl-D-alanine carboxypeptidase (penicillin-binding protein 5/6)